MEYTYETKCIMVGRKPRVDDNEFKTLTIGLYDVNDPHKAGEFPKETLDLPNIERVVIHGLKISYYLEGNDMIVNDLVNVRIVVEDNVANISGVQEGS